MAATLRGREIAGIYLFLKRREGELDATTKAVLDRLEQKLYNTLSIEEFEGLESLYRADVEVLRKLE
jgi:hypothetical protein